MMADDTVRDAAIVWVNAVYAHWGKIRSDAEGKQRAIIELAIEMAKVDSPDGWEALCGPTHPPVYATIRPLKTGRDPWIDQPTYAVMVQYLLGDARPFWAHYYNRAAEEIERRAATDLCALSQ